MPTAVERNRSQNARRFKAVSERNFHRPSGEKILNRAHQEHEEEKVDEQKPLGINTDKKTRCVCRQEQLGIDADMEHQHQKQHDMWPLSQLGQDKPASK